MPRAPRSYDEISRHTVVEPDGSWRAEPPPTEEEQRFDRQVREAIYEALLAHGIDTVGFEVIRGRVILRGVVRDERAAVRIERIITEAAPEAVIDNRLRIGS
jgi:osmotically-inducible protein OsmY